MILGRSLLTRKDVPFMLREKNKLHIYIYVYIYIYIHTYIYDPIKNNLCLHIEKSRKIYIRVIFGW